MSSPSTTGVSQVENQQKTNSVPMNSTVENSSKKGDVSAESEFSQLLGPEIDVSQVLESDTRNVISRIPKSSISVAHKILERTRYHRDDYRKPRHFNDFHRERSRSPFRNYDRGHSRGQYRSNQWRRRGSARPWFENRRDYSRDSNQQRVRPEIRHVVTAPVVTPFSVVTPEQFEAYTEFQEFLKFRKMTQKQ